jgi:hypothetical protein
MSFVPKAVDRVAKKIARMPGVEASYIGWDGAVDAVLETAFDRVTRQHVLDVGKHALVPVRVFYRMPDGDVIGEDQAAKYESLDDFYTDIHVAGFAGDDKASSPDEIAGDAYGDKDVSRGSDVRGKDGQLKLTRIRASSRGRPVVGWKYGDRTLRVGDSIKFKKACCLQWTMGRTVNIRPGATGKVSQMSSRRPIAYLSLGNNEKVELPIHAVGHVYDVMVDPNLESVNQPLAERAPRSSMTTQMKRLVMTIGFGREPGMDDEPTNSPNAAQPVRPDLHKYSAPEEDMLAPPQKSKGGDSSPTGDDDDDRKGQMVQREPKVRVRKNGIVKKKTVLLGRK